jgi:thioredoxin reductase (NADPH)
MDGEHTGKVIPEDAVSFLKERFSQLKDPVTLYVFTKKGENDQYSLLTQKFTQELAQMSENIKVLLFDEKSKETKEYNISHFPTVLIQPKIYNIRYIGAPFGEESRSLLDVLHLISHQKSSLSEKSKKKLENLSEKRDIKIFITLNCPYCPGQVLNGFKAAIQRPDLISASCVDAAEQMQLARSYQVGAVPHTVINEQSISKGFESEDQFIEELITLKPIKEEPYLEEKHVKDIIVDLIIIGGGPAGLTAGLYAARSGLHTIVIEKNTIGGQVSITPIVENWPGFSSIPGKKLMDMISSQVQQYVPLIQGEEIIEIKIGRYIEALSTQRRYLGKALIIATGATHRKLGIPGEEEYYGRGVSYCATCDGYLFKDQRVVIIGGGNTALTDALYLKNLGARVNIIHRGEQFSAEQHLIDSVNRELIPIIWNTIINKIKGDDMVTSIEIQNEKTGKKEVKDVHAVFVAIGEEPNNTIAAQIGIELDDYGFVKIDRFGRTNIPRIYAAGDLTGGVRQIVTAVSEGATAATSAFQDITHPKIMKKA